MLFISNNIKFHVTSYLYNRLVITCSRGHRLKAKPRKYCVFLYIYVCFIIFSICGRDCVSHMSLSKVTQLH